MRVDYDWFFDVLYGWLLATRAGEKRFAADAALPRISFFLSMDNSMDGQVCGGVSREDIGNAETSNNPVVATCCPSQG